ncbi:MAG: PAS domain S-box protein [Terriglobia bacterium]
MEHSEKQTQAAPAGARNDTNKLPTLGSLKRISSLYAVSFLILAAVVVGFIWHDLRADYFRTLSYWNEWLSSSADSRVRVVTLWWNDRRVDLDLVARNPLTESLLSASGSQGRETGTQRSVERDLDATRQGYGYMAGAVLDSHCRIAAQTGIRPEIAQSVNNSCQWLGPTDDFKVIAFGMKQGHIWLTLAVPVFANVEALPHGQVSRRKIGAVVMVSDPWRNTGPLIAFESTPTRTSDTLLVWHDAKEAFVFSPHLYARGAEAVFWRPLNGESFESRVARENDVAFGEFTDYRGVRVFGVGRRFTPAGDSLARKVDRDEALSGHRRRVALDWLVGILSLLLLASVMVALHRHAAARASQERARQEDALRRQAAFDALMTNILARFATCAWSEVDASIISSLQAIAEFMKVDRAFINMLSAGRTTWSMTHEWCGPNVPSRLQDYQNTKFGTQPWSESRLLADEIVRVDSTDNLPPEALAERRHYVAEGTFSALDVPIKAATGTIVGCLGLHSNARPITWSDTDVAHVRMIGDAIATVIERKRAEEALKESDQRYRDFIEHSNEGVWRVEYEQPIPIDLEPEEAVRRVYQYGYIAECNEAQAHNMGFFSAKEVVGGRLGEVFPVSDEERNAALRASAGGGWQSRTVEFRSRDKTGALKHLLRTEIPIVQNGMQVRAWGITRDITELRQAEEELRKSEQRWRAVFENSAVGIALTDCITTQFQAANLAYQKMLGYTEDELRALTFMDITYEDDREPNRQLLSEVLEERRQSFAMEKRYRRKDGSLVWVNLHVSLVPGTERIPRFSLAIVEDITERKRAEEALRRSEQRYKDFISHSHEGVWRLELEHPVPVGLPGETIFERLMQFGYIAECNLAYARIMGYSAPEAVVGKRLRDLFHPSDQGVLESFRVSIRTGLRSRTTEFRDLDKEGNPRYRLRTEIPIVENGMFVRAWGITRDITEIKAAEDAQHRLNRELEAISNCNQALLHADDEQSLLNDICRIICDEAGYRLAWVGYAENDEAKTVRPVAWAGFESGYVASAQISWAEDTARGCGPTGTAIRAGKSVCAQDVATDPLMALWRENALQRGYRSNMALPLKDEKAKVFGALTIYSAEANAITPEEMRLMEELAGDLAFGITVVRGRLEHRRAEQERERSLEQLRALTARLQSVREEERKRVAREIHDQLGQALTAIKIDLISLIRELPAGKKQSSKRTDSILQLVDESIRTVRRISTELRPGILDDLGLVAAIQWAGEDFQSRTGMRCRLDLPREDIAVDPEQATAIFRIFQETLTNVARHAGATAVEVRLAREFGNLTLEVHDNGKGIPEDKLSDGKSLGILGMRERAMLLGGELAIISPPGKGTTVKIRIPEDRHTEGEKGHD